jgi:omega-6 fatty acid desaturase / acyl-lipid omega-6 desaturase (Delta-12 desaturase)
LKDTYGRDFNLPDFTMNSILEAIPPECFNRSAIRGAGYIVRDLIMIIFTALVAHYTITLLPNVVLRFLGWMLYAFVQGCFGTGIWVLAHECGHQAFSQSRILNDSVGWVLHSCLLVPYFSWQITHAKHHKATCHMSKDVVLVPKTLSVLIKRRGGDPSDFPIDDEMTEEQENKLYDLIEEAPIISLYVFIIQHTLGWLGYLSLNLTGQKYPDRSKWSVNHFNPTSPLFSKSQYNKILLSDLGVILAFTILALASRTWGFSIVFCYYFLPYFWVNHWLVLITYLQHTDPALPHYRTGAWTFQRGAAATMDRDFGFIGQHIFHDIINVPPTLQTKLIVDSRCSSLLFSYSVLSWSGSNEGYS